MKTTKSSLKLFRAAALAMLAVVVVCALSAQAGYTVTLQEVSTAVQALANGSLDLTGLTNAGGPFQSGSLISPSQGLIWTGGSILTNDKIAFSFPSGSGPTSFGSGGLTSASAFPTSSGSPVGIGGSVNLLYVPIGYTSNTSLIGNAVWSGQTFASLGVTPGTYEWIWGAGANQNFTLQIVPEPATYLAALLALGLICWQARISWLRVRLSKSH